MECNHHADFEEETFFGSFMFKKNHAQDGAKSSPHKGEHEQDIFRDPTPLFFRQPFIQPKGEEGNEGHGNEEVFGEHNRGRNV